ncbi:acyl-CoA dehydrogenase/oxidase [Gorgonomyces haynaldii]|nr:acyl-CoA dehydrogenase/oxidase [Gorgonomyces haynaldii]
MLASTSFFCRVTHFPMSRTFSRKEVAQHNSKTSLWIVIDTVVYDITKFLELHPGGEHVLLQYAGKDATQIFYSLHRQAVLEKYKRYVIGSIEGEKPQILSLTPGTISPVPFAEPTWLTPVYHSPYYSESHRKLQKAMRIYTDTEVLPEALRCENTGERPDPEFIRKQGEMNLLAMRLGPGKHLHGLKLVADVKPEEFDYFHELVITQELSRIGGARGFADGMNGGMVIGLPPIINFGSPALKAKIVPEVFSGKKFICLAISEAFAGSDVAGMQTTAEKTPDGKFFIVNGTKKWITNGMFSDYFTVGCKTKNGYTVLLIERGPGVETTPIKTSYSPTAGTAYVTFDNVRVPVENVLGKEDQGFAVIMSNFNHERWVMCCGAARSSRYVVEECLKWCHQRKVFGKPLISQPVIRQKLAKMVAAVEATQSWLESITFQMNKMSYKEQAMHLAGPIALLKMHSTRVAHDVADDAIQIFGGRGITKTGMGSVIEGFARTYKFDAILGGSEEILADLGIRQAVKNFPKAML